MENWGDRGRGWQDLQITALISTGRNCLERNQTRAAGRLEEKPRAESTWEPMISSEGHAQSCLTGWLEALMRMRGDFPLQKGRGIKLGLACARDFILGASKINLHRCLQQR